MKRSVCGDSTYPTLLDSIVRDVSIDGTNLCGGSLQCPGTFKDWNDNT